MKFHSERLSGCAMFARCFDALPASHAEKERDTARFLSITVPTLRRYLTGKAEPPAPLVALLWHESAHGRETLDEHAHRGMLYAKGEARAALEQADRLRRRVAELESEIDGIREAYATGRPRLVAANASAYRVA